MQHPLLCEIPNPPAKLFMRGAFPPFDAPWIAVVGTRKATRESMELARTVSSELARKGFVIVSGLAMGIDTAAHWGALDAGVPTVAVLGNGIDKIYPAQNENLAKKILENGAIVSEYPGSMPGLPHQFLERNRIVAGMCVATIVIEAPKKSGALVTARLAAEYGREVFVLPGPAGHPQHAGSHALIRDGARLVHSTKDILEDLALDNNGGEASGELFPEHPAVPTVLEENSSAARIVSQLSSSRYPQDIDKIIESTTLTAQEAHQALGELTVYGIVEETAHGYKLKR